MISATELIKYAGATGDHVELQANEAIAGITAYVAAYTRGNHVDRNGEPRPGIRQVVLSAAARVLANPSGVSQREQIASFSWYIGEGFNGFNLAELAVLKRYRKRAIG